MKQHQLSPPNLLSQLNIVIPMKGPRLAKSRLKKAMPAASREALALQLFVDTLEFFVEHFNAANLLIVTESEQIASIARRYQADVLLESTASGLNQALTDATKWSLEHGFLHQLIVPADIPLLNSEEIAQVLNCSFTGREVVIAQAKDGGTNALFCTPPNAIDFYYGYDSAETHFNKAKSLGLAVESLTLKDLSRDVDWPEDLSYLNSREKNPPPMAVAQGALL